MIHEETIRHKMWVQQAIPKDRSGVKVEQYISFSQSLIVTSTTPALFSGISRDFGIRQVLTILADVTENTKDPLNPTPSERLYHHGPGKIFDFGIAGLVALSGLFATDGITNDWYPWFNIYNVETELDAMVNTVISEINNPSYTPYQEDEDGDLMTFGDMGMLFGSEHRIPVGLVENYLAVLELICTDARLTEQDDYEPFKIYYGERETEYEVLELVRLRKNVTSTIGIMTVKGQVLRDPDEFAMYGWPFAWHKLLPQIFNKITFICKHLGLTDYRFYSTVGVTPTTEWDASIAFSGMLGKTIRSIRGCIDTLTFPGDMSPTYMFRRGATQNYSPPSGTGQRRELKGVVENIDTAAGLPEAEKFLESGKLSVSQLVNTLTPSPNPTTPFEMLWNWNTHTSSGGLGISSRSGLTNGFPIVGPWTLGVSKNAPSFTLGYANGEGCFLATGGRSLRTMCGARVIGPTRVKVNFFGSGNITSLKIVGYASNTPLVRSTTVTEDSENYYPVGAIFDLPTVQAINSAMIGGLTLGERGNDGLILLDDDAINAFFDMQGQIVGVGWVIEYDEPANGDSSSVQIRPDDLSWIPSFIGQSGFRPYQQLKFGPVLFASPCFRLM